jgi:hypothetical protein
MMFQPTKEPTRTGSDKNIPKKSKKCGENDGKCINEKS